MYSIFEQLNKIDDKRSLNEEMNTGTVRLEVQYEPYTRYGGAGGLTVGRVSGKDELTALTKLVGRLNMYLDADTIVEENLTVPEILARLEEQNGDGCDFIIYIKNLSTGETLLDGGDYVDYEEWDDESEVDGAADYDLDEGFIADIKKNIKDTKNQKIADAVSPEKLVGTKTSSKQMNEKLSKKQLIIYVKDDKKDVLQDLVKTFGGEIKDLVGRNVFVTEDKFGVERKILKHLDKNYSEDVYEGSDRGDFDELVAKYKIVDANGKANPIPGLDD